MGFLRETYSRYLLVLGVAYVAVYGALLGGTGGLPYVLDNNESFSSLHHAYNLYHFSFWQTYGVTDEAYGPNPQAHPFLYTHQGNFPRVFAFLIFLVGARTVESQIWITTFTVGSLALFFAYHYFAKVTNPLFGCITCLVLMTDYMLFAQWQVVTYRVWHGFFFFASLLCALGVGAERRRLWALLTVGNYACLFYYEPVFATFVATTAGLYTAWLYRRSPRLLFGAWGLQAAGAALGLSVFFVQLTACCGLDNTLADARYTLRARNFATDPAARAAREQFYDTHHIVFWPNYLDGSGLRSFRAFRDALCSYALQVHTPLFSLLVLTLAGGWFLGLARLDVGRVWRWLRLPGVAESAAPAGREGGGLRRFASVVKFALLLAAGYLFLCSVQLDPALVGPRAPLTAAAPAGDLAALARLGLAALGCFAALKAVTGDWLGVERLPFPRTALAAAFLLALAYFIRQEPEAYESAFRPFYQHVISTAFFRPLHGAAVGVAGLVAVVLILGGTRRFAGEATALHLDRLVPFLGCGFAAYAAVYLLFTGYVYTGYLCRWAPLVVFLQDAAVAVALYAAGVACKAAVGGLLRGRQPAAAARPRMFLNGWSARLVAARAGAALLAGGLLLYMTAYWVNLQRQYITLLPPTHYCFLTRLREAPYRGKTFAVNTYAAPVAAMTGTWAYFDPKVPGGKVPLTPTGYEPDRDLVTFLWLADKRENPAYAKPDYFLSVDPPTRVTLLARLQRWHRLRIGAGQGGPPDTLPAPHAGGQGVLDHRLEEADGSGLDSWAIWRLDWDFPPYLQALPGHPPETRVALRISREPDATRVEVCYAFAHQEGKSEAASTSRLWYTAEDGEPLLLEQRGDRVFRLPPTVRGTVRASVIPCTATKAGVEYWSDPLALAPDSGGANASP